MTRDEAKQALKDWQEAKIDAIGFLERLGLLKLDEPKSAEEQFYDVVTAELTVDSPAMRTPKDNKRAVAMILHDALSRAGLRIVVEVNTA